MPFTRSKRFANGVYLFISALSIGWMVGMSISPTVHIVITSITTVLVAIVSLISGLNNKVDSADKNSGFIRQVAGINLFPIALLTVGLVIGSSSGIYTRTHKVLGKLPQSSDSSAVSRNEIQNPEKAAGLYSVRGDACGDISWRHGEKLQNALIAYGDSATVKLVYDCKGDSLCLELIKKIVCEYAK